ncbi:MAG: N-acyl-D-glucosamine 2-epimerase [Acidobacteria bacterium]|nr:MAG: N-acyl-D-glucosamine 2-epimerase [Acidobacteriota bacterium]
MFNTGELGRLRVSIQDELKANILPFWLERTMDLEHGGFWGRISNDLTVDREADKGLILNARILWTFSRLFSEYRDPAFREMANRAYDYLMRNFWDPDDGGTYWMVSFTGEPVDTKKRTYGQAFTIYALSEFAAAFKHRNSLEKAKALYSLLEDKARDTVHGGYFETFEKNWQLAGDQRLSEVDMDEKKSMNTHLHVLEAYANLLKAWENPALSLRVADLLKIFLLRIVNPATWHFRMFFEENWESKCERVSFGHDIEGSWLLSEAADIVGEQSIQASVRQTVRMMAMSVLEDGMDVDGGLLYEAEKGEIVDDSKHWWPQAEAVVGFLNAYQLTHEQPFLEAAATSWQFIERYIVDRRCGEWFWKVSREGIPSNDKPKVDAWKGPYHNTRACLEAISRLTEIEQKQG